MLSCKVCEIFTTVKIFTFETKHVLQLPFYHILEQEISTGMRTMRKKLNMFMLQLPIYYILEQEISTGANADIAKPKRKKKIVFVVER